MAHLRPGNDRKFVIAGAAVTGAESRAMRLTTVLFAILMAAPLGLVSGQDVATKTSGQARPIGAEGDGALLEIRS